MRRALVIGVTSGRVGHVCVASRRTGKKTISKDCASDARKQSAVFQSFGCEAGNAIRGCCPKSKGSGVRACRTAAGYPIDHRGSALIQRPRVRHNSRWTQRCPSLSSPTPATGHWRQVPLHVADSAPVRSRAVRPFRLARRSAPRPSPPRLTMPRDTGSARAIERASCPRLAAARSQSCVVPGHLVSRPSHAVATALSARINPPTERYGPATDGLLDAGRKDRGVISDHDAMRHGLADPPCDRQGQGRRSTPASVMAIAPGPRAPVVAACAGRLQPRRDAGRLDIASTPASNQPRFPRHAL